MSKEQTNEMDALMGGGEREAQTDAKTVSQEVFDRTNHELDVARGRLKASDTRIKELEKELAQLRSTQRREDIVSQALTAEEREKLAPEFLSAASKLVVESEERIRRDYEERERLRQQQENDAKAVHDQRAKENFGKQVEERFPGFFASVKAGGANSEQWKNFYRLYGPSIAAAYSRFDLEAVSHFITEFHSSLGIRVPSGSQGRATSPDPRTLGSGASVASTAAKTYTEDDINALFDKKEAARDRGDWAEVKRLTEEINRAQAQVGAKQ